jgi:DNA-directed RNA polymerase subunit RPC12/RpoP
MTEIPTSIVIRCQNCKQDFKPTQITKIRGICTACNEPTLWQIRAEYAKVHGSNEGSPADLSLKSAGLNIIGLTLLASTGVGFTYGIPGHGKSGPEDRSGGKSLVDIFDITTQQLLDLCFPPEAVMASFAAFIHKTEIENQRKRMAERGAVHCRNCNILFVPSADKPWTLVSTCSKTCCVAHYQVDEYSQIEKQVQESSAEAAQYLVQKKVNSAYIRLRCKCGNELKFPQMYKGTYRKCSNCGERVLVPLHDS